MRKPLPCVSHPLPPPVHTTHALLHAQLVLSYHMGADMMCEFSKDEWVTGLRKCVGCVWRAQGAVPCACAVPRCWRGVCVRAACLSAASC